MTRPQMRVPLLFTAAGPGDAHLVADLIATAFQPLEVAAWLVADPDERLRALYADFRIVVEHAIAHGEVWITGNQGGVAVWLPRTPDTPVPEIGDYARRVWLACGRYTGRFTALDDAFAARHPTAAHHHLAALAVHPDRRSCGLGSALLTEYHSRLDRTGIPAYLEASSRHSRALYLRHGYTDHGQPIHLPDHGPQLWPMWRTPQPTPSPSDGDPAGASRGSRAECPQ
ncbi:GNAT family N-acetyltransferase [Dactylosporangium sp. NPDC049140]|uniref:GNAT family N-acetyltransferase n=1 Tax=Dactylosporangium sp. NPDC049140 TaxID=3155647 RepID=UPI0033F06211